MGRQQHTPFEGSWLLSVMLRTAGLVATVLLAPVWLWQKITGKE